MSRFKPIPDPHPLVEAADFDGWNYSLLGFPRWTIRCGRCGVDFKASVPVRTQPRVGCPHCGAVNQLPLEAK